MKPDDPWVVLIGALLTGGGGKFLYDSYKDWRDRPTRADREVASVDASILSISRARDELEADNARLRATMKEERGNWFVERARYEAERSNWTTERDGLRQEIARLEAQIRQQQADSDARYAALLETVNDLRRRAARAPETPGRGNDLRRG